MQILYAARLGLQAQQERVNTIANNVANANTLGFKSQRMDFKDALYTQMINPANLSSTDNLQRGTGTLVASTTRDFALGTPSNTGNPLDLYLDGDGFFTVSDSNGALKYTRSGCFGISSEEDGRYLVTAQGHYVLDTQGNRIRLPQIDSEITVSTEGAILVDGNAIASLRIVDFPNKSGLSAQGDGCYIETEVSGQAIASQTSVRQGVLENSNVDLAVELSQLIRAQRAFSLAGKAVGIWDEMTSNVNNLRV